jgi:hypothetical protein
VEETAKEKNPGTFWRNSPDEPPSTLTARRVVNTAAETE